MCKHACGMIRNMRKLALSDEVLMSVDKAARYIGHEVNAIYKDLDKIDIRFCMCFPDVYEVGMSHIGIQILYEMFWDSEVRKWAGHLHATDGRPRGPSLRRYLH